MEPAKTIGRYRVLATLGSGAMGEVLRARDERLGRDVAIKRVRNVFGAMTAMFHSRFEAEARALAALAHPGVVQVFDLGIEGEEPYLVMELVEGQSLRAILDERGPLAPAAVRSLGIQLSRALEAAHARGIVHRDIKPGNVLQAPGGVWKLADFGVARVPSSELTVAGQFMGTPAYAAPEALVNGVFGPESDVFGLAAMLVEAATGKKPRRNQDLAEMIARAREPISLDGVPNEIAAVIAPALSGDPSRRPTAAAMAEALAGTSAANAASVATRTDATAVLAPATPIDTIAVPDGTVGTVGTVAVPDGTVGTVGTVAVPDGTIARSADRRKRLVAYIIGGVIGVGILAALISTCAGGSHPPAARSEARDRARDEANDEARHEADQVNYGSPEEMREEPRRFEAPPDLDRRGAHMWHDVATAVHEGEFRDAIERLGEFEQAYGRSEQSAQLGEWLRANQQRYREDD